MQPFVIVNDIYVVDFVQLFGLQAHLFQAFRHTPVLVDGYHFRTHQTTGGIFIVLQEVYDVSGLLYILNMRQYLFFFLLVEVTHQVYGIVRIHIIHKPLGNGFRRQKFQEFLPDVFVHFYQYVGGCFVVEETVNEACLFGREVITQFGNICRMQVDKKRLDVFRVFLLYKAFDFIYVFFVYFHNS